MMKLHFHPMSGNSRRAMLVATHLAAKVDLVRVALESGEQRTPEFLRLNPNGRVPVLEDGALVLWESNAIIEYLADKTPGQTVYPTELAARADVSRWLFWSAQHFAPAIGIFNWENSVKKFIGLGDPDPVEISRGEKLLAACAHVLDRHLEGKTWLAQDRLTLADFSVAAPLAALVSAKLPIMKDKEHPHLRAWFSRVEALDAWKKTAPERM